MLKNHGDILYNFYVLKGNPTLNFENIQIIYSDYIQYNCCRNQGKNSKESIEFYKIKEKVIGRTIQYNRGTNEVLPEFMKVNYEKNEKLLDFMKETTIQSYR